MPFETITEEIYGEQMTFMNNDLLWKTVEDRGIVNKYIDIVCREKGLNKEEINELVATNYHYEDYWEGEIVAYLMEIKVCETLEKNGEMYYRFTENV